MTHRGPFQPGTFCDSVIIINEEKSQLVRKLFFAQQKV